MRNAGLHFFQLCTYRERLFPRYREKIKIIEGKGALMPKGRISSEAFKEFVADQDDLDVLRIAYCYQVGSTFIALSLMEDTLVNAMSGSGRIQVSKNIDDGASFRDLLVKRDVLQSSTLGSIVSILSKHGMAESDLKYLRWIKGKRDFFVHRFFQNGAWPGDISEADIVSMCRSLLYLDTIFRRATNRVWRLFERAGLVALADLGEDGAFVVSPDFGERFGQD